MKVVIKLPKAIIMFGEERGMQSVCKPKNNTSPFTNSTSKTFNPLNNIYQLDVYSLEFFEHNEKIKMLIYNPM